MADPTAVVTVPEARRAGHSVQLESITHRFGATTAVDGVSLPVEAGDGTAGDEEFVPVTTPLTVVLPQGATS